MTEPETAKPTEDHRIPPLHVPVATALQYAAACMQVGCAFLGLLHLSGGRIQIGLPPLVEGSPEAQGFKRALDAGIATAQSALESAQGRIVAPF